MFHVELQLSPDVNALLLLPGQAPAPPDPLQEAVGHTGTEQHQAGHQQHRPRQSGGLWQQQQHYSEDNKTAVNSWC